MRFFPGETIPGLSLATHSLPAPWVIPSYLPREHRQRLVTLLWRALEGFEPGLRLVELRWHERMMLEQLRLRLPRSVLLWWRMDALTAVEPLQVLRESGRFGPVTSVFEFEQDVDIPAFGWMGALKLEVLHRLVDVLLDERPVDQGEPIAELLGEAAGCLTSPVDLLDFAEALISASAQHLPLTDGRALAYAQVLAARFDAQRDWGGAAPIIRALVALVSGQGVPTEQQEVLKRAGLVERDGTPLPMVDVLSQEQVFRRTVLRIVSVHPLDTPLWELAPAWFSREESEEGYQRSFPVESRPVPAALEGLGQTPMLEDAGELAEEARQFLYRGDVDVFVQRVVKAHQRAMQSGEPVVEARRRADVLMALAEEMGRAEEAKALQIAAVQTVAADIYEQLGEGGQAGAALVKAGVDLMAAYHITEAMSAFKRAKVLLQEGDERGLANCLFALGTVYQWMAQYQEAEEAYERALPLFQHLSDRLGEANCLLGLGDVALRLAVPEASRARYEQALSLYREFEDRLGEAHCLKSLGNLALRVDDLEGARRAYEQALPLYREFKDRLGEASCLRSLGDLALYVDDLERARHAYEQALSLYREFKDRLGEANCLQGLGQLALAAREIQAAFTLFLEVLQSFREVEDQLGQQAAHGYLARTAAAAGALDQALLLAETSLAIGRQTQDRFGQKITLDLQMRTFAQQEDVQGFFAVAHALRDISTSLGDKASVEHLSQVLDSVPEGTLAVGAAPEAQRQAAVERARQRFQKEGRDLYSLPSAPH